MTTAQRGYRGQQAEHRAAMPQPDYYQAGSEECARYMTMDRAEVGSNAQSYGSGRLRGAYKTETDEVIEVWESEFTGFLSRVVVWPIF